MVVSYTALAIGVIAFLSQTQVCRTAEAQRCGRWYGYAKCSDNSCCSDDGYCGGRKRNFCNLGCQSNCNSHLNNITRCTRPRTVALTFEDGPSDHTDYLLDVLQLHGVKATFIIYGDMVSWGRKDVLLRIYEEGHSIGSLGQRHGDYTKLTEEQMIQNLYDNEQTIKAVTGVAPKYFRPPYLTYNYDVSKVVERFKLTTIMAGINTNDWKYHEHNPDRIYDIVVSNLKGGSPIILQHDTYANSVGQVDRIIRYLKSQRYDIVNMDECLEINKYPRKFAKFPKFVPRQTAPTIQVQQTSSQQTFEPINPLIQISKSSRRYRCGAQFGYSKCADNSCCSRDGYCGETEADFCNSGCQSNCNSPRNPITQCTQPKTVALTFDDGPSDHTNTLLDTLKAYNVKATFFIYGDMVFWSRRAILKRAYDEGHTIASHTFNHPNLTGMSEREIREQLDNNEKVIQEAIGVRPKYFRPPYLAYDSKVEKILDQYRYVNIMVGLDSDDWKHQATNPRQIYNNVVNNLNGKSPIILFHDTYKATVDQVDDLILHLRSQGYNIVSMEDCLK